MIYIYYNDGTNEEFRNISFSKFTESSRILAIEVKTPNGEVTTYYIPISSIKYIVDLHGRDK